MERELSAIRLSAYANVSFGVLGMAAGLWLDSEAILLDGIFNWISFGMALLSIKVARLLRRPGNDLFPFGYAAFEPLINTVKAMLVLGVSALALFVAIHTLLGGGRELQAGWALAYAVIAMAGCFGVAGVQGRVARQIDSPLVAVDAKNWLVNGAISSAVGLAFGLALVLRGSADAGIIPYIDSVLVILLVVLTVPIPARMAIDAVGELLAVRPPDDVMAAITTRFREAIGSDAEDIELRVNRLGRTIFVVAKARVAPDRRIDDLESVRRRVFDRMREHYPHLQMAILFGP